MAQLRLPLVFPVSPPYWLREGGQEVLERAVPVTLAVVTFCESTVPDEVLRASSGGNEVIAAVTLRVELNGLLLAVGVYHCSPCALLPPARIGGQ